VVAAFRYTYFFCAMSAIYLLLRQDVDEKEMDEICLEGEQPPTSESPATRTDAPHVDQPAGPS
jgi:hypothetical protein